MEVVLVVIVQNIFSFFIEDYYEVGYFCDFNIYFQV